MALIPRSRPPRTAPLAASLALVGSLAGCSGGGGETVVIDGSSTVFPISRDAVEAYSASVDGQPRITVSIHGTGGGFGNYMKGDVDIIDASRPAKPEEEAQAEELGFDWTRFLVGHDGITVAVNPENTFVESLTVDQLREMFRPGSTVTTWRDVDPEWPDQEIRFYTPDLDSGTYEFFVKDALGMEGQRDDVQANAEDNVLVRGIAGDEGAIGYFGYAYYAENEGTLKAVAIRDGEDAEPILPTPDTIYEGSYTPLSRPLFIYVKDASMERPLVADFVTYYLENIEELARGAGYVAPNQQERVANAEALARLKGETAPDEADAE